MDADNDCCTGLCPLFDNLSLDFDDNQMDLNDNDSAMDLTFDAMDTTPDNTTSTTMETLLENSNTASSTYFTLPVDREISMDEGYHSAGSSPTLPFSQMSLFVPVPQQQPN
jgi:hypothetical protein